MKKQTPSYNCTCSDATLSVHIQQRLLIDLVDKPDTTPVQIIQSCSDLYGNPDKKVDAKLCTAVKSKYYYYKKLKEEDEAGFW